jgi:hypothetical protein
MGNCKRKDVFYRFSFNTAIHRLFYPTENKLLFYFVPHGYEGETVLVMLRHNKDAIMCYAEAVEPEWL